MSGWAYILRAFRNALLTFAVALTINFALFRAAPGDASAQFSRIPGITPDAVEQFKERFGIGEPLWSAYIHYLDRLLLHGDAGTSLQNYQSVAENLKVAYLNTIPMVLAGIMIAIVGGIAIGILGAWKQGRLADNASVTLAVLLYSMPGQWLGLMLLYLFAGILPAGGRVDPFAIDQTGGEHILDVLEHMVLPAFTLGLVILGQYVLIVRSTMVQALSQDYITTARAKGVSTGRLLFNHGFRNALLPVTTLMALSLGAIASGSVLIETVFSWPGVGRALYDAVTHRDWPMLQGAFLVITSTVIFLNLVVDLLALRIDPRVAR